MAIKNKFRTTGFTFTQYFKCKYFVAMNIKTIFR